MGGVRSPHVALLRGLNVGGNNRLPMAALAAAFVAAGCAEVRTYIQSGNVVFSADTGLAGTLPAAIAACLRERHGIDTPVVVRPLARMLEITRHNPFLARGLASESLHVVFLTDAPSAEAVRGLDPGRSPPDEFIARGSEIYLHLPGGMARSRLTNQYFDTQLRTVSTARNWRTVTTLLAMMQAPPADG